jgi:hypothetical protein
VKSEDVRLTDSDGASDDGGDNGSLGVGLAGSRDDSDAGSLAGAIDYVRTTGSDCEDLCLEELDRNQIVS